MYLSVGFNTFMEVVCIVSIAGFCMGLGCGIYFKSRK